MEVGLKVLCDAANVMPDGRLNILGEFEVINFFQVPFIVPSMALVLRLIASPGEKGTSHIINVVIVDEDGKPVAPPAIINVPVPISVPGVDVKFCVVLGINSITFQKFGDYRLDITINNESKGQIPFKINAVPRPPGMQLPGAPPYNLP
jgi:hypothetical protein